jgi:16S rRNA (guanine(966)-N(2))-methyltransferase RsmD
MRVVAGSAGGLVLKVPKSGVRPTMDRVKAAMFSMLGERVVGSRVLDLFAGTGALGIEALSRGAVSAVFVEKDPGASEVVRENLIWTRLGGLVNCAVDFGYDKARAAGGERDRFDLIFADPPYACVPGRRPYTVELLDSQPVAELLVAGGLFVLEKEPSEAVPEHPGWELLRQRRYGATEVLVMEKRAP